MRAAGVLVYLMCALFQMAAGYARIKDGETIAGWVDFGFSAVWITLAIISAMK